MSKMRGILVIRKIENGREPLGYKHFVPNGTFSDSRRSGATAANANNFIQFRDPENEPFFAKKSSS
jgi:hypothetical protein